MAATRKQEISARMVVARSLEVRARSSRANTLTASRTRVNAPSSMVIFRAGRSKLVPIIKYFGWCGSLGIDTRERLRIIIVQDTGRFKGLGEWSAGTDAASESVERGSGI